MLKKAWFNICYALLFSACWLFGKLPSWLLYHVFLDIMYFFVYKVVGYRLKVVRGNLRTAFPEKTEEERRRIERKFYLQLAEVFIDTVDFISISEKGIRKRMRFPDIELHEKQVVGKSWIAAVAHYGSWEYFASCDLHVAAKVVGVYHKIHNPLFEKLFIYSRSRFGSEPVPMQNTMRFILQSVKDGKLLSLGLIADQSPRAGDKPNWVEFFGQQTDFYLGPEKIALKFKMPVYFTYMKKHSRAHYSARFELIYDGVEEVEEGEITRRYAVRLEEMIREAPWLWMWSHKRWKKKHYKGDI